MGSVSDNERSRAASTFPAADMARTDPGRSQSHQQSRASSETLPGTTPSPQLNPKRAGFVSPQLFPNHSPAQAYSSLPLPPLHRGLSLGSPGAFTSAPHRGQEEGPGLARPSPRPHRGRSPPRGPGTPRPGSPLPPPPPTRPGRSMPSHPELGSRRRPPLLLRRRRFSRLPERSRPRSRRGERDRRRRAGLRDPEPMGPDCASGCGSAPGAFGSVRRAGLPTPLPDCLRRAARSTA